MWDLVGSHLNHPNASRMMSTTSTMSSSSWVSMPPEVQLSVLACLPSQDLVNFGLCNHEQQSLSIISLYHTITLSSLEAVERFIAQVPTHKAQCVRHLEICTKPETLFSDDPQYLPGPWDLKDDHEVRSSELVHDLLMRCGQIESLDIQLCGTILPSATPAFSQLANLQSLKVSNCASEEQLPISERLIVALASEVQTLTMLEISGIARSLVHAPELLGSYPVVPIADDSCDEFPSSPVSPDLRLPELMSLPRLRSLSISDTHLGDANWKDARVSASLETVVIGAPCAWECPETSQEHTKSLLANPSLMACKTVCSPPLVPCVAPVTEVLPSVLPPSISASRSARFPSLTPLQITPATSAALPLAPDTPALSSASTSRSSEGIVTPCTSTPTLQAHDDLNTERALYFTTQSKVASTSAPRVLSDTLSH